MKKTSTAFGKIELHHEIWFGQAQSKKFGRYLPLTISSVNKQAPTQEQERAYQGFMAEEKTIHSEVEQGLFDFYNSLDGTTKLAQPSQIWSLLSDTAIHIPEQENEIAVVELIWRAKWGEQEAVSLIVENNQAVEVGFYP